MLWVNYDGHEVRHRRRRASLPRWLAVRLPLPPRAARRATNPYPTTASPPSHPQVPYTTLQPGEAKVYRTFQQHCWQARCLETARRM